MEAHQDPRHTMLAALRYLEMESVAPTEAAADFELPEVAEVLREMADDHSRHRQELELLLSEADHKPVVVPETFLERVDYRVRAVQETDDENEALEGLLRIERFSAERYEEAIASGLLDDQRRLLNRHLEDERRHEQFLSERVRGA